MTLVVNRLTNIDVCVCVCVRANETQYKIFDGTLYVLRYSFLLHRATKLSLIILTYLSCIA